MMYITIAIYRQASMNIRIDVGQQQNWWWWWGVHKAKKILLHFSLNHGILSRMALFLEKLEFFFYFRTPSPPVGKFQLFFFWTLPLVVFFCFFFFTANNKTTKIEVWFVCQHTSISVLDTTRVSIFLILTYAACVICKRNSDVTVMQQLCHNSITVMSLWRIGDDFWTINSSQIEHENVTVTWQWRHWNELWCH